MEVLRVLALGSVKEEGEDPATDGIENTIQGINSINSLVLLIGGGIDQMISKNSRMAM